MATSKNLERVCAIVLIVSLLASAGLVYVKANGGESTGQTMGYESRHDRYCDGRLGQLP